MRHRLSTLTVELTVARPKVIRDELPGEVRCQGQVGRSVPPASSALQHILFRHFRECQFVNTANGSALRVATSSRVGARALHLLDVRRRSDV